MARPKQDKKIESYRLSTTARELIDRHCTIYNTTRTEAVEQLLQLGTLLCLSNEYNTTSAPVETQ
jgi:hypothetical protein